MYKGLVFDFDGTLFTSEDSHFLSFRQILKSETQIELTKETYIKECVGLEDKAVFRKILGEKFSEIQIQKFAKLKGEVFHENTGAAVPTPGVLEFLQKVKDSGRYKLAICTGAYRSDIDAILEHSPEGSKIKNYFEILITASDVPKAKPDPACYLLACKKVGIAPKDCLAFEDSPPGLVAAKAAGLTVWAVPYSYPQTRLSGLYDRYLERGFAGLNLP